MLHPGFRRNDSQNEIFFILIFDLSRPNLARNEAWITFFYCLNFFYYLFWIFWECSSLGQAETVPRMKIFFSLFGLSQIDFARNEAKMTFFLFFWEISSLGWAETVLKMIFFFYFFNFFALFRFNLTRNDARMTVFVFWIFF